MVLRRTSLLLPCRRWDDFPTHLTGSWAAELLAAWTALWHPAFVGLTGSLPAWHPADDPPDPTTLEGELVLVPRVSRQRLAGDWCDRLRATCPRNPPPVETVASREQTIAAAFESASIEPGQVTAGTVADFLALGYTHLHVELLTRAMRHTTLLDTEQFTGAVVAAARAAVAGNDESARDELGRAFDLLADARNHVYAVDFYLIDVTLLAASTLGQPLRAKLASGLPTSLLANGELVEQLAREHPATLAELRRAIGAGAACVVGGVYRGGLASCQSPEAMLVALDKGRQAVRCFLEREGEVFGQFAAAFSPLMPELLTGVGFRAALHASFDGGRLPRAEQCKTRWGPSDGPSIQTLSTVPLDIAQPETWLKLAERVGDSIAHDQVATVLLAGWPGQGGEYYEDLRRAAGFNPVLGRWVTLEEYFRVTREPDDWTTFFPREYPCRLGADAGANAISARVDAYRQDVFDVYERLSDGLAVAAGLRAPLAAKIASGCSVTINPWNFPAARLTRFDPLDFSGATSSAGAEPPLCLPDVPGCGYATLDAPAGAPPVPLAQDHTLRNERLELTVSAITGGIQSLRTHRDRSTRVSQRLVFHEAGAARTHHAPMENSTPRLDTQMVAERIEITRNDAVVGEITSQGRLLDAADELLARFTQKVRVARGLPAAIVQVELDSERRPEGDMWNSYFASRLAWSEETASFRRGVQWVGRETTREKIESPEWVEVFDGLGTITCFGLGLPFHRRAGPTWLDTLLLVAGEERNRWQFAIGLDCPYSTQTALGLLTTGRPTVATLPSRPPTPCGWFLHASAKNIIVTHIEPLAAPQIGIRVRLLEIEGRAAQATLAAFRPFQAARTTDFRGNPAAILSVVDGQVRFDVGPYRWLQVEAEW